MSKALWKAPSAWKALQHSRLGEIAIQASYTLSKQHALVAKVGKD
jgi:hypothetical protein